MAVLNEIQSMLRDQAEAWTRDQCPVSGFRRMRDSGAVLGYEESTWQAIAAMGWAGIVIPESCGGSGLDYQGFGLVLEQLGRQLVASPLFASGLVGASALLLGGSREQQQRYLPAIADGASIVTLAIDEGPRHQPLAQIGLTATASAPGYTLHGAKTFVPEGMAADTFVVAARTSGKVGDADGLTLFLVCADSAGLQRAALQTIDSRGYAAVRFDTVAVTADAVLGEVDHGAAVLEPLLDRARAGLAAEMLGCGARAFDMTLEYLKTRRQFGKLIGSFQALGHRAAELYSQMELARSCVEAALKGIDDRADDSAALCAVAQVQAGEFLHAMSCELIQVHGGIGMTDEFDAGFYLKRARVLEALYGNRAFHRDRFARLAGF